MKHITLKNLLVPVTACAMFFSSCKKVEQVAPLGDSGQRTIQFLDYGGLTTNFAAKSNLSLPPTSTSETLKLQLEFLTPIVSSQDIIVTVAVDAAALAAYNATISDPTKKYNALPTTAYTFPTTQVKIPAGTTMSVPFYITFNPSLIDGSINFMLPLSITAISGVDGVVKAPGTGTAYFHFIGNPLAGLYNVVGTRYNYTSVVTWAGPPAPLPAGGTPSAIPTVKSAAPIDGQTVKIDFAALGAGVLEYYYLVTGNADFSAITVNFNDVFLGASSSREVFITNYVKPTPTTKASFHIYTHYNNNIGGPGAGGVDRIMDELFTHQ